FAGDLLESTRQPIDFAQRWPLAGKISRPGGSRSANQPAYAAAQLCHAPARCRRRYPQRAGIVGAPELEHYADIHPRDHPPAAGQLSQSPSAGELVMLAWRFARKREIATMHRVIAWLLPVALAISAGSAFGDEVRWRRDYNAARKEAEDK